MSTIIDRLVYGNHTHGRRKGRSVGAFCPLDFENLSKKSCFLSFEWEKNKFCHFCPPLKILEKSPSGLPGKNNSAAHEMMAYVLINTILYLK